MPNLAYMHFRSNNISCVNPLIFVLLNCRVIVCGLFYGHLKENLGARMRSTLRAKGLKMACFCLWFENNKTSRCVFFEGVEGRVATLKNGGL